MKGKKENWPIKIIQEATEKVNDIENVSLGHHRQRRILSTKKSKMEWIYGIIKIVIHLNVKFYNYLINDVSGHGLGGERMQKKACIPHHWVLASPHAIYPPLTGIKRTVSVIKQAHVCMPKSKFIPLHRFASQSRGAYRPHAGRAWHVDPVGAAYLLSRGS